jgi:hypothetical protein
MGRYVESDVGGEWVENTPEEDAAEKQWAAQHQTKTDTINKMRDNILAQKKSDQWTTGRRSTDSVATAMATRLYEQGITRLEDFGQRDGSNQVTVTPGHYESQLIGYDSDGQEQRQQVLVPGGYSYLTTEDDGFGGTIDYYKALTPEQASTVKDGKVSIPSGQKEYYNKTTGQTIPGNGLANGGDNWGVSGADSGNNGFKATFNEMGMPIFYSQYENNSSNGLLNFALSIASIVPGPWQIPAMVINSAYQYSQGNTMGAVLGALGAGAQYFGAAANAAQAAELANDIDQAQKLGMTLSEYSQTGLSVTSAETLQNLDTLSKIKTTQQGISVLNAIDKKNFAGLVNGLVNMGPQIGVSIPEDLMKPIQYAAIGSAASKGDWTGAMLSAATLTNNSYLKLANSGVSLVNAFKNPSNIGGLISAVQGFVQQAQLSSSVLKDTAKQAGLPLSDANANKLMQSTVPSETDKMLTNWLSEAKTVRSNYEKTFGQPISDDLLEQLNGEAGFVSGYNSYVNSNAGQVDYKSSPAGQAAEAARVETARVEADRVEAARIETARVAAETKAAEQTQNIKNYYKQVLGRDATQAEINNFLGEFGGLDKAIEEATKRTTVTIGNAEADNPQEAAAAAKFRNPYATQFTYGGNTYSLSASNEQLQQAYKDAELSKVSTSKTFNEAFATAKDLKAQGILGENEAFTWNGQSFNTNLAKTATEASAFDPNTVFKAKSSLIEQLADTKSWQGANLSSGELAKFTDAFAKATPEQRASMLKGSDAATYKIINDALTTTRQATDATQIAIQNGTLDLTKPVTGSGSISENNANNYLGVVKNIGNNIATDLASTALGAANLVGTTLGFDTSEIKNLQKFMSDDQKKQMDKLVGQEKYAAAGLASAVESLGSLYLLGATTVATLPMVAFAVNNAWVEGANSWVATDGKVYDSKEEAIQAAGKDNIRQLTTAENATRAALMGVAEFFGEKFGLPGMAKLMKGIPIGGTAGDILNAVKNAGFGAGSEVLSELFTTATQMGIDKIKNIGLGQNATMQNVADAMKDTLFTTLWAVGGSSTVGSASSALKNVSTDPIPQFQSPVLPEDVWARAKDAGVSTDKINALKAEASSLSSVGEITKITSEFKDSLAAAGFTPQEIQRLTAPAITDSVNTSVVSLLKASGVPAGQIADVAKQATSVLMSGGEPTAVARNLLDVFYANNIDPIKANTMAADYTGLMTPAQVSQAVKDAIAANPTITPTQLETAISNAAKNYATAADIKSAISGITFPAGLTSTDVTKAITAYMTANPGLSIKDVATSVAAATKDLATSSSVNTSIGDALKGYATTQDIKDAISGIKFPAGLTSTDVTTAIKNYMTANPGLSLSDVSSKITDATKNLATTSDVKDSIGDALKGYATAADVTKAISNIKFPEGITTADVTSAITNYMKANPGLSLTEVANAISTATTGLASNDAVKASINAALKDVATTSDISAAISGIKFPAGLSKDDVTASIKAYMAANPGLSLADVSSKITDATKGLATTADVKDSIGAALKGYATATDISTAISNIKFPTGITPADVTSAISSYMKDNPGLSISDVASKITDATKSLATSEGVTTAIGNALKGYATSKDIETAIANIKFPAGISTSDVKTAISDYMKANPGLSLTDVASNITNATKGLATSEGVKTDIAAAIKGFATNKDIETAISNIKFPAGLSKDDVKASIADYMKANPGLSLTDVAAKITDATKGLATTEGTKTAISDALKGYATTSDIQNAIKGIQFPVGLTSLDVTSAISTYMKANPGLSISDVASKITDATKGLATTSDVKDSIGTALKGYATAADISTAISNIKFPVGITSADITAAIKNYMTTNPGLSLADVAKAITTGTTGLATDAGVKTAISTALKDVGTKSDISAAISGIKFPVGLTKDDVTSSIKTYMTANPGLSLADVALKVTDATKGLATSAGVTTSISEALKGYATSADINKAIAAIKFPVGLSKSDVAAEIKTAMDAHPNLTAADVTKSITNYMTANPAVTAANVQTAITAATKDLATKSDITAAIKDIKFPVGMTSADVTTAISNYMKSNPGLSLADVSKAITAGTSGLATDAGVKTSISDALKTYATSASLASTQKTILDQVAKNEAAGMTRDTALQTAISSVAAAQKTDTATLSSQISKLNTAFGTEVNTLKNDIDQTEKDILAQVAINEKAGMTRDAALQTAINTVASTQKTDTATLTSKMTTMGTTIGNQITAVQLDLAQTEKDILAQVAVNEKAGMTRDAALQTAINTVATNQKADTATLASRLSTVQTSLGKEISAVSANVAQTEKNILAQVAVNEKAGMTRDAALQSAINTVAATQKTDVATLASKMATLGTTVGREISAVQTELAQTEKDILAQVAVNEKAGMTRDAALQSAINSVAATQKTDAATLTSKIGTLGATLGKEITTLQANLAQTEKNILAQVAVNEKAGMTRDVALQSAINTVAATQKTDVATLTKSISGLNTTLGKEIDAVQADLAQTEKDILAEVAKNETAGMTRDAALQKAINSVAATQKTDVATLTTKMGTLGTTLGSQITAVQADLAQTEKDILAQVAINEKAGMTRDAALQQAINTVAATQKTDTASILTKLNTTATGLDSKISGIQANLAQTEKSILAQVAVNEKAGMSRDTALQQAINTVAATQKTDAATLTSKLSTMGTALGGQITALQADLDQTEKDILVQVAKNEAAGMGRDVALQQAINTVAATQKTDTASILSKLNTTAAGLDTKIAGIQTSLAQTEKSILAQVAVNEKAGMSRDAALQSAINTVAATQKTDAATLTSKMATLGTALGSQINTVQANLAQTEKTVLAEVAKNEAAGLSRDAALQKAINTVAATQNTTAADLTSKIGTLGTTLNKEVTALQANLAQTEKSILAQVAVNEKAGMSRDVALQSAINTVATAQKTDTASLTSKISGLGTSLTKEIDAVQADLDQTEKNILAQVAKNESAGMTRDAALQTAINTVATDQKKTASDILTKLGTTSAGLDTKITGLQTQLAQTQKDILAQVAKNEALGMTRDTALQAAINTVAASQKTDAASLTAKIAGVQSSLGQEIATQVSGLSTKLTAAIDNAIKAGQTGDAALQTAIGKVSAELGTTKTDLLSQLGKTQTQLQTQFSGQLSGVETKLTAAIQSAIKAGQTGDAALQTAINKVSTELGTTKADLLSQVGKTEAALTSEIAAVQADLAQTEKDILAQVAVNERAGMTRDAALQSAINTVAATQKTDAATLTAKIAGVQTALGQQLSTQISGLKAQLSTEIAAAVASGLSGDAALQKGLDTLSAKVGTNQTDILSQLGKTTASLKTDFTTQLSTVQSQLSAEINAAVASGLSGDAALQKGLDTLSAKMGTNQTALLTQLGKTTDTLKADFSKQLAGVTGQVSTLQTGLNALSGTVKTQYDSLTQAQKDAVASQVQQGKDLTKAISDTATGLQTQITGLSAAVKAQYDSLTQAQKDAVAAQAQQGKDFSKAITDTATGLQTQITGLSAETKAQYDALTQAQKDSVAAQAQQGKDLTKAITDAAAGLQTQITGLSGDLQTKYGALTQAQKDAVAFQVQQGKDLTQAISESASGLQAQITGLSTNLQTQYSALTQAQKDAVALQVQQGKDLTKAITDNASGLQTQITGLSTDLQTKYDTLTQGQKDIVNTLTQQGVSTATAINEATKTTTEQISTVKTDLTKNITDVQTQFNTRVDELMRQGTDYQTATQFALKELGTGITGIQGGITDIKAQQAADAAKAAAATKASRAGIAQSGIASNLAKAAAAVGAGAGALVDDSIPGYKDIGLKTTGQTAKFESVLSPFQQMVEEDNKAKQNEQQNQQQNQQGASMSENLNIENPKLESDYFNYGYDSQIEQNLSSSTPQFYKAGGLATPLFAGGGTTRYGRFAGGGLNVVEHSGKARLDFRTGNAVTGPGDGQSDDIPAMLADGEFVFPADVVAALGNGSTKAGSDKLYDMMHSIRAYHRSAKPKDLPPPAKKSPLDYLKKTAKSARR